MATPKENVIKLNNLEVTGTSLNAELELAGPIKIKYPAKSNDVIKTESTKKVIVTRTTDSKPVEITFPIYCTTESLATLHEMNKDAGNLDLNFTDIQAITKPELFSDGVITSDFTVEGSKDDEASTMEVTIKAFEA